eukprot:3361765-Rhodomonas_salina.1
MAVKWIYLREAVPLESQERTPWPAEAAGTPVCTRPSQRKIKCERKDNKRRRLSAWSNTL